MSTLNQHLLRRGAIYHYRRRLPAPLKGILNRTHFDGSLETADPARARRLARQLSVAMDQLAERLQGMPPSRQPTPGQLNLVLKELFDSLLKDCERRRDLIGDGFNLLPDGNREEIMDGTADPHTLEVYEDYKARGIFDGELPEQKAAFWQACAGNNVDDYINPLLEGVLESTEVDVDLSVSDVSAYGTEILYYANPSICPIGADVRQARRTSSCFMLMIWSSRARNRSPEPSGSFFDGRIRASFPIGKGITNAAKTESQIARIPVSKHWEPAISTT